MERRFRSSHLPSLSLGIRQVFRESRNERDSLLEPLTLLQIDCSPCGGPLNIECNEVPDDRLSRGPLSELTFRSGDAGIFGRWGIGSGAASASSEHEAAEGHSDPAQAGEGWERSGNVSDEKEESADEDDGTEYAQHKRLLANDELHDLDMGI